LKTFTFTTSFLFTSRTKTPGAFFPVLSSPLQGKLMESFFAGKKQSEIEVPKKQSEIEVPKKAVVEV
jgi:hypothetical protein